MGATCTHDTALTTPAHDAGKNEAGILDYDPPASAGSARGREGRR